MKEENDLDPLDEMSDEQYKEVERDFLLEVLDVEAAADTLAWLKDVKKHMICPYRVSLVS